MSFVISKILAFILQPLVWVVVFFLFAFFIKNKVLKKRFFITSFVLLIFFSNGFIIAKIYHNYELDYSKTITQYDVGILLGGFSKSVNNGKLALSDRGDRLMQTIQLYKNGTIKKIMLSGGSGKLFGNEDIEADLTYKFLKDIGIPDSAIVVENKSRNTIENAKFSLEILTQTAPKAKILVISSAWHLPRVKMIYSKLSTKEIDFYPTDILGKTDFDISDFILPDPSALSKWNYILKEWVGYVVDSYRS